MKQFYQNTVVASVTFDANGELIPFDRPSMKGLRKAEAQTRQCFVRDINAHETIAVHWRNGSWVREEHACV